MTCAFQPVRLVQIPVDTRAFCVQDALSHAHECGFKIINNNNNNNMRSSYLYHESTSAKTLVP